MRLIALSLLVGLAAHAEVWNAQGAGAEFSLKVGTDSLDFLGRVTKKKVELQACNRELARAFVNRLRSTLENPGAFVPDHGINLTLDGERVRAIDPKSPQGLRLLTIEDEFVRFFHSQEILCSAGR